ncbi:MAG: acetoin utilization protein AcuB [Phenylobacterium sp.]
MFLNGDSKVYATEPVTDIRRIAGLMIEKALHTMPIIENGGKIVGIISRTDIIKAVMTEPPLSLWC